MPLFVPQELPPRDPRDLDMSFSKLMVDVPIIKIVVSLRVEVDRWLPQILKPQSPKSLSL